MPRARSRRSSSARCESPCNSASIWSARAGSRSSIACASRILHAQRHQLLLRSVVDVALEPPSLLVLRGDESALGRLQFLEPLSQRLRQTDVAQHQPGLRREIGDQLLLGGVHRVVGRHRHREGPELLSLVQDGHGVLVRLLRRGGGPGRCDAPIDPADRATHARARRRAPRPARAPSARARRPRRRNPRADPRTRSAPRTGSPASRTPHGRTRGAPSAERAGTRARPQNAATAEVTGLAVVPHVEHDADADDDRDVRRS